MRTISRGKSFALKNVQAFLSGEWQAIDLLAEAGKISALKPAGSGLAAEISIDLNHCFLCPGWVDLHTHLYPARRGYIGTRESRVGLASGVTALLDVGTVGAANFEDYKRTVIDRAETPVYCLLNIKSRGIRFWSLGRVKTGEDDLEAMVRVRERYPSLVKGVKVTASEEHMAKADPMYYVRKAIEAGAKLDLPVMVHIGRTPPELEEILPLMRPGDVLTHCFRDGGHHILDAQGRVRPSVREAQKRGVNFDVGHGVASFSFEVLEKALDQGFDQFSISSDLYILSVPYRAKSFSNVLSKFLAAGMRLEHVLERASSRPAKILGLSRSLSPGQPAELTAFRLQPGSFKFKDCWGAARRGKQLIRPVYAASRGNLYRL